MNFLGHAAAARWQNGDARFVLGAMLPDFAHMAGVRRVVPRDAITAAGVAFHHRTDEAFHGCPSFHRLCHDGCETLQREGVGRGPSLAVSHLAIELLLDGVLASDDALVDDYRAALRVDVELEEHGAMITRVRERLHDAGAPSWYAELDELAPRLERILARHPRLALAERDRPPLRAWLDDAHVAVIAAAAPMLDELRARLG
ncbi:MAG TPA: hypothetical protein VG755_06355 [Nannocystaceae bacterium]|nr:hypothetical protein [Nannocystaceae bacterium]